MNNFGQYSMSRTKFHSITCTFLLSSTFVPIDWLFWLENRVTWTNILEMGILFSCRDCSLVIGIFKLVYGNYLNSGKFYSTSLGNVLQLIFA